MNYFDIIRTEWQKEASKLAECVWSKLMQRGELRVAHYASYLRETYFNTGKNPQLQTYAGSYFGQENRDLVKKFCQHAASETGHDLLALNDLQVLGADVAQAATWSPLPETVALTAYAFYTIQFVNPISYLGYLFHLEFLPTSQGNTFLRLLAQCGVPKEAMTFLADHTEIDLGHNKLMEMYVQSWVRTEKDLRDVVTAARITCRLHCNMVDAAVANPFEIQSK